MKYYLLIIIGLSILTQSNEDLLKFKTIQTSELEQYVKENDKLFVLFFDRIDKSTEDIHREFLKA